MRALSELLTKTTLTQRLCVASPQKTYPLVLGWGWRWGCTCGIRTFPGQESNPRPQQQQHGILNLLRPQETSLDWYFEVYFCGYPTAKLFVSQNNFLLVASQTNIRRNCQVSEMRLSFPLLLHLPGPQLSTLWPPSPTRFSHCPSKSHMAVHSNRPWGTKTA